MQLPRIRFWEGISADLSISSIQEGIRQYLKDFEESPTNIFLHPIAYDRIKKYVHQDIKIPLVYRTTKILNEECFILAGYNCIFMSSEPI